MKIGVVGLGSMGKRRVRDLAALGHEILGCDVREDRREESAARFSIRTSSDFNGLLDAGLDAVVISAPTDLHVEFFEKAFAARLPFFSEAGVLTPRAQYFKERERQSGVRGVPSATWRFHPLFSMLRDQVRELGADSVTTVHGHYAGYLPAWHPWEEYDAYYAGRERRTCAAREMVPFEAEWMTWILGPVARVSAVRDCRSTWRTDIDDAYLLHLEFENGVRGTLNVELHQVAPFRHARIGFPAHALHLDVRESVLKRYDHPEDAWRFLNPPSLPTPSAFTFEDVYAAEIGAFAREVSGGAKFPKTWKEERHLSNILYTAEESWRRRAWVDVAEAETLYDGLTL